MDNSQDPKEILHHEQMNCNAEAEQDPIKLVNCVTKTEWNLTRTPQKETIIWNPKYETIKANILGPKLILQNEKLNLDVQDVWDPKYKTIKDDRMD